MEIEEKNILNSFGLNPIEKYRTQGKFPYKMVVHILLVIFTTAQVISTNTGISAFSRSQEMLFYNIFFNTNDKTDFNFRRFMYFFDINSLKVFATQSIQVLLCY